MVKLQKMGQHWGQWSIETSVREKKTSRKPHGVVLSSLCLCTLYFCMWEDLLKNVGKSGEKEFHILWLHNLKRGEKLEPWSTPMSTPSFLDWQANILITKALQRWSSSLLQVFSSLTDIQDFSAVTNVLKLAFNCIWIYKSNSGKYCSLMAPKLLKVQRS